MGKDNEPSVLLGLLLGAVGGCILGGIVHYLDEKFPEREGGEIPPSLAKEAAICGGIGAVAGGLMQSTERSRLRGLKEWHQEHPRLSRTMRKLQKNPQTRKALKRYADLTDLGGR